MITTKKIDKLVSYSGRASRQILVVKEGDRAMSCYIVMDLGHVKGHCGGPLEVVEVVRIFEN